MGEVRGARREHDFHIACQFNVSCPIGIIGNANAPQLGVIFGRDNDFRARNYSSVGAAKLSLLLRQGYLVRLRLTGNRKITRGPDRAAANIAQVTEATPVVAGGV